MEAQNDKLERRYRLEAEGFDIEKALKRAAEISGLTIEQIRAAGKEPRRVQARSPTCYWAVRELRMTTVAVSKVLGICPTAVTKAVSPRRTVRQEPRDSLGRVSYKFTPRPYCPLTKRAIRRSRASVGYVALSLLALNCRKHWRKERNSSSLWPLNASSGSGVAPRPRRTVRETGPDFSSRSCRSSATRSLKMEIRSLSSEFIAHPIGRVGDRNAS